MSQLALDNSTSPLVTGAACDVTYAQRPALAEQPTPGVAFTWQCFQTSAAGPGAGSVPGAGRPVAAPATFIGGMP